MVLIGKSRLTYCSLGASLAFDLQVIGTLPWVVNPTGIATATPAPATLPAQNLQVQAVTPQLLLNAQGQVIATLASTIQTAATVRKSSPPESPAKSEVSPTSKAAEKNHQRILQQNYRDSQRGT